LTFLKRTLCGPCVAASRGISCCCEKYHNMHKSRPFDHIIAISLHFDSITYSCKAQYNICVLLFSYFLICKRKVSSVFLVCPMCGINRNSCDIVGFQKCFSALDHLVTNSLESSSSWDANSSSVFKKCPLFYWTRKFITA
jgi:hypothetical protein